ncbi:copia protein, partial [Tanacetum coccineum]
MGISTKSSHRNRPIRRSSRADSSLRQLSNDGSEEDQASESRTLDDDDLDMNDRGEQKKKISVECSSPALRRSYESGEPRYERGKNPVDVLALNVKACYKPQQVRVETVPINQQVQKRENHGSSNEEALQSSGQILEEDMARKERNEIDKFDSEWDEKKKTIVNDFSLEKTLIRNRYGSNSYVRSEKLYLAEKEFADKLNEHERLRQVHFNDLKAKLKVDVGQVVVNDEISLNGPAHETQIVDLMESGKEDQESREVAPALLGLLSWEFLLATATKRRQRTQPPQFSKLLLHFLIIHCQQFRWVICTVKIFNLGSFIQSFELNFDCCYFNLVWPFQEIHNDSHLLQQPTEDRIQYQEGQADHTPMVENEDDNMQNVEAIQVDQIIPEESSLNPHNEPSSVMSANPTITENQAAMLPTSEVLAQTTAAQTQIQRNANFNQVASQMPRRVDPLHIELEQLSSVKEKMIKSYHDCIQKINIDCEKEIAEAIAEIRLKYHNKRQEADATFNSRKKEVESNMYTVVINQVLAATFRQKCQDVSRGCVALQQACQAESMQQVHRFSPSTCLPGQFPGTQQTPPSLPPLIRATTGATPPQQKQPPCQIIHQPSALFLTPLTRHPHTTNLRPANTTPIRPPPNTETCGQSPQSRPLVSSVTRSTAPHMRPLVSREFQTPGPHMRPFASSGIRSSTSPMRPSNPASSSGPPGFGTYHRTLPVQHVTSSVPLTSPSNSQPLNSTSSVQPLPPLPWKRFLVPQPRSESPHASVATSAHSSLLRGPSVPQIGGPQDKLNDNVKTLTCNAARALNILKTPEFPGGGNGAQPPSAHELKPDKLPSPDRDWNKTLPAAHGSTQPWLSILARNEDPRESFDELMDTPLDFSAFVMNRLNVDSLTPELLAGPTFELMKGTCKSLVELEYFLEEVYKATTEQLDWINPEGQQYPHDLRKPLPLIPNSRGRRVIPFDHFINNDLEYLSGGVSSRKYATSVTKTKAADYGHIKWIEDLVPNTMWSPVLVDYDKHALWGISHWGRKRQQFYGFAVNRESARDVYSKRRIIAVTKLEIVEWQNYKHLDWITVRRDDDKLYTFKEGDLKRLRIQDIEDMLLLLVQGKLTNLTVEERLAFNVSLRMFTRSIVIQRRVEDLQLGVESYQKKLNLTKPDTYRSDLKRRDAYSAYSTP